MSRGGGRPDLPAGYLAVEAAGRWGFTLPELRGWVEEALATGTLHRRAAREAEATLRGRGPVHVVAVAGTRRVARHYRRGGAVAPALGDRYLRLGVPRPLREVRASEAVRDRGIATTRVAAGAVYPAGLFYRADLVTDYVPGSRELAAVLLGGAGPEERREALAATGELIARMASAGVRHPDLNARNVLLTADDGRLRALLVDLDRCAVTPAPTAVPPGPMVERLVRSIRKLSAAATTAPGADELEALRQAASPKAAAP